MLHLLASWTTWRNLLAIGNVAFSLLAGVVALAICAVYYENTFIQLLDYAGNARKWIVSFKTWPKIEIVARLVLHESSILLMFFTLGARIVMSLVLWLMGFIFRR